MDRKGLANYIARHPRIKGIGPAKARVLAEKLGAEFDQALQTQTVEMARAAHVGVPVIENLRDEWLRSRSFNLATTLLASFELTHHQISALVKKYGNSVVAVFKADPYMLIREVEGYGFKRVDKIARKRGLPRKSSFRVQLLHAFVNQGIEELGVDCVPSSCFEFCFGFSVITIRNRLESHLLVQGLQLFPV
jgi:exodeoxyribonuclease V alpha subunit